MMDAELKSNQLVFAGPFLGEFGWEISHWAPHVRWLRQHYPNHHMIVASFPGRKPLYHDVANEFWPLPEWFLKERYDVDCFEALAPEDVYGKLLEYFKNRYENDGSFSKILATRAPRGFNHCLRELNRVVFSELQPSSKAQRTCDKLIKNQNNKPCVIIFAREVKRKMFLDIKQNRPIPLEMIPGGLPSRNWPRSHWEDLFDMLYDKFSKDITFVIGGTKGGNCLLNKCKQYEDVIDLTDIDLSESLDVTIAFLKKSLCSISSQSGPTHLSLQTKCPSFIYGHEEHRHSRVDNPFKTDVAFFETELGRYNESPDILFQDTSTYIYMLLEDKRSKEIPIRPKSLEGIPFAKKLYDIEFDGKPIEKYKDVIGIISKSRPKEIGRIGMIGVFDVEGSTNIPFANSFSNHDLWKYNYRTEAKNKGVDLRNREIIAISKEVDLMIFCKGNGIDPSVYEACAQNCTTVFFMMDSIDHLSNLDFYDYANLSDFSVVTTGAMKNALLEAGVKKPIHHMIQPIDPKEFYPVETDKKHDVIFIGTRSEKRDNILSKIREWGYSVKAYGNGYGEYVTGEAFNRACTEAKICLAINNTDPFIDSFSDRVLRYLATKALVVTEYSEGLENYFKNKEDLFWFTDLDQLKFNLNALVSDMFSDAKNQIAEKGYGLVLEKYTWKQVSDKIIAIANEVISNGQEKREDKNNG